MGQEQPKGEFSLLICFYMLNYMLIIENQCIPIHTITHRCPLQCCSQTYVPLLLAHSCTIRDLSTMTLPKNTTVVCDIGETHCEQSSPGLLYTCVGKSTNLYNTTTPSSTTVYFTSLPHSLQYRTQMESMKKKLQQQWYQYMLQNQISPMSTITPQKKNQQYHTQWSTLQLITQYQFFIQQYAKNNIT